jgi:hypothetical protein
VGRAAACGRGGGRGCCPQGGWGAPAAGSGSPHGGSPRTGAGCCSHRCCPGRNTAGQPAHSISDKHRLNIELDLQSLFGSCVKLYSLDETPQLSPFHRVWAHIRGRYWPAKKDDISL